LKQKDVLEKVWEPKRLNTAWRQVKKNAGAAGIDLMTVKEFERRKQELMRIILIKLKTEKYRFKPARRVLIPKEGSTKKRKLGIPVVIDRIIAQSIHTVFEEIFDPDFTENNFGFRRGKSQHQAIEHVRDRVVEGYSWCASIDLKSFFDEIPHDLILKLIRRKVSDEGLVTLVARELKAGVVVDGRLEKTIKGCPQGSPLSPMLSNIVLNEMDHELERRGLKYARWADDFVILLKSKRSAQRAMESITGYLEASLGLPVNWEKSEVAKMHEVSFLGFRIYKRRIQVSKESLDKFKMRVRELTHRNNPLSMYQAVRDLNKYLRGLVGYFRIQEFKLLFGNMDRWTRNRLRSMQLKKWKKPNKFQRIMISRGFPAVEAHKTWVAMKKWQSVHRKEVRMVIGLEWFRIMGLVFLDDFTLSPTGMTRKS
jgi:RNA-directed DNA polymerase